MRTKLVFLVSLLALALVLSACGPAASASSRSLSVSGTGTVYLTPDIAYLYVGVHTEDADIAVAVERNNTRAQALVDALIASGVSSEDIQTSNFSVWSYDEYDDTGMRFTNYSVDNSVYITVRDLSQLGTLLNTAVAAGANNINSIQFDVADKTAALEEARRLAMENANALADELAQTAGVSVGEIQTIAYTDYYPSPYYGMGGGGAEAPNASVPIQPGQMQVSVTVSVTYGIK
ncbi:MAG: SIMPL domain-containing protein [Chloroflexi bacterium]|nr:SIMPL domain-containing protein [Chloroflexota bacterium]